MGQDKRKARPVPETAQPELEIEVTLASAHERRRVWITADADIRPGRRMQFEHPTEPNRWWRITDVGQMRLRS